jgi:hypothetical protein
VIALALGTFGFTGAAAAQGWGTVKGRVVWGGGEVPAPKPIEAVKTHQDKAGCEAKGPVVSEEWVINKDNNGVRWVFVWLAPAQPGQPLPVHPSLQPIKEKAVEIDQPCCRFEPHAVGLRQGQTLVVKNSAPFSHNVNWSSLKNPGGNQVIPAKGSPVTIANLNPDKYPLKLACNIHPWMSAWVRIFDHPYFAVTDADGKFEIKDAPAGNYRVVVWHETGYLGGAAGKDGRPVNIPPGGVADLGTLELKP